MTTERLQAVYDQIAEEFAVVNADMPPELAVDAKHFVDLVGLGAHVLDLGCGTGRDLTWLERLGVNVTGADLSAGMLAQAQRITNGSLVQMDLRCPAFPKEYFQGVWCNAALLHLPKADVPHTLERMRQMLIPGGALYLAVQKGSREEWEYSSNYGPSVARFFARYDTKEIAALLEASGFVIKAHAANASDTRRWLRYFCTTRE
jgi:ubiquinone/menaquinone biosynthesis C-methylase UbiE